jgi:uncharacterized protein YggE
MNTFLWTLKHTVAVALAASVPLAGWVQVARGDDPLQHPTIAVSGKGKIEARPDIAEVTAGVVTHAPSAKDALAANNEAMSRMLQILKERGIAEKDIRTSQIQIAPQYSQPRHPVPYQIGAPAAAAPEPPAQAEFVSRIVGYRVENSVRITSRRIEQLGPLLDAVVQGGANHIFGISFRVEHAEKLLDEVRKRAMADATHKAQLLAGEAGAVLGPPLKIEAQEEGDIEQHRFFAPAMAAAAPPAPTMAVSPGEQELAVTVSVIYELKDVKQ